MKFPFRMIGIESWEKIEQLGFTQLRFDVNR